MVNRLYIKTYTRRFLKKNRLLIKVSAWTTPVFSVWIMEKINHALPLHHHTCIWEYPEGCGNQRRSREIHCWIGIEYLGEEYLSKVYGCSSANWNNHYLWSIRPKRKHVGRIATVWIDSTRGVMFDVSKLCLLPMFIILKDRFTAGETAQVIEAVSIRKPEWDSPWCSK